MHLAFWTARLFHNEVVLLSWTPVILEQIFTMLSKLFLSFTDRLLIQHITETVKRHSMKDW